MGTRAFIGIENEDGTITSIYNHWDGYPEGVGQKLLNNYNTEDKIRELLSYGDVSNLGEEIGEKHDFDTHSNNEKAKDWCLFYNRDREEEDVEAKVSENENDFLKNHQEDFTYLFRPKENKWYFREWKNELKGLK